MLSHVLRILIRDPVHHLRVRTYIRGWHIFLRADDVREFASEVAGEAFQFPCRKFFRIDFDAAFAAAEGDSDERVFHRHPEGERFRFVEIDLRMEAKATFIGPEDIIVLHAIAAEDFRFPAVQEQRDVHFDDVIRLLETMMQVRMAASEFDGALELCQCALPRIVLYHAVILLLGACITKEMSPAVYEAAGLYNIHSSSHMRSAFCIAAAAAPLPRLSRRAIRTAWPYDSFPVT